MNEGTFPILYGVGTGVLTRLYLLRTDYQMAHYRQTLDDCWEMVFLIK
ncbi:hypothetical protein [Saccharococcus caldoxylosilyticus]|uniref:Uncharacterized protein n=2 Tax=Saccharococcus caldoxylosilyticus TaxID=81408 RepID=A0A023DG55_9BACL|nr:hypothetical protein [Parageobacillus caldoxylosilyticus]QNU39693.1 hypothetical protein IC801_12055 [Geobacillus sp. 44B]KYD09883.1 hypothetical protein B4119_2731 [Parageobacillus caldoxylosilyticus]MBB3853475.1 hypothetical protein [Parageobacillus caldoxylosilyticus]QXJ39825.1 hypothetical protein BV455_03191 [Parageobacillus caldoxylosilyticus]BDG36573.1 hypothetical protein PcaKH15_24790 [Parageobacillus caldoxylosilyticus]